MHTCHVHLAHTPPKWVRMHTPGGGKEQRTGQLSSQSPQGHHSILLLLESHHPDPILTTLTQYWILTSLCSHWGFMLPDLPPRLHLTLILLPIHSDPTLASHILSPSRSDFVLTVILPKMLAQHLLWGHFQCGPFTELNCAARDHERSGYWPHLYILPQL